MAKDISELSTERLRKRITAGIVVMTICWTAVITCYVTALILGKAPSVLAASAAGLSGLGVASLAIGMGIKKGKAEIARRESS